MSQHTFESASGGQVSLSKSLPQWGLLVRVEPKGETNSEVELSGEALQQFAKAVNEAAEAAARHPPMAPQT